MPHNLFGYAINAHANARLYQQTSAKEYAIAQEVRDKGLSLAFEYHSDIARFLSRKARNELWNLIGEPTE